MPFLDILEGISPWWWVAFAFALGALEMATMSFFLIWPGLAALCMAALLAASPTLSGELQTVIFAVLAVLLTFIGRYLVTRYGDGGEDNDTLNQRSNQVIGRVAKVLEYGNGEGVIEVSGMRWRAKWPKGQSAEVGTQVRVTEADGMTLLVETTID
jgi:inner membrane protein